jgi:Gram-negative bacterial TonB protein C-terminal
MLQGTQRYSRTKMVLPLRVWLDHQAGEAASSQWAHTIDTCDVGCRIGGLRTELAPGQIITVQRGQQKAAFRVIWSKHLAANENQAGIEAVDQRMNIWATNAPTMTDPADSLAAGMPVHSMVDPRVSRSIASTEEKLIPGTAQRRLRFGWGLGFLFLSLAASLLFYHQVLSESGRLEIGPLAPAPPTARDLARLTPKPHFMLASLTKPLDASIARVQVAEAPTGRVVYPVAPDESVSGKVRLEIVIAANGLVKQIHLLSGKLPLAEAAAQAVRLWHYGSFQGTDGTTERETSVTVSFLGGDAVSLQFPPSKLSAPSRKNN